MPMSWIKRWQSVRWIMILLVAFLVGEALYYTTIRHDEPPQINDTPEGLTIDFTVNQSAVLTLEACVSGRWNVQGADEIRVNGGNWTNQASGRYTLCNQPDLSPTLDVRLPSSAIASYQLDVTVIYTNGLHTLAGLLLLFTVMWIVGIQDLSHRRLMMLVVGVHMAMVIVYYLTTEMSITNAWTWDSLVHTLPMADLRYNLLESMLYQHAQPPLYSVYGIILDTLFGEAHPTAMFILQVGMGTGILVMGYGILWHFTQNKSMTLFVSILLALNPAMFLFESLILYTMLSAFWIMSGAYCLLRYRQDKHNRYLYLFVLCINLLVLTRSVYHIVFLIPVLILVGLIVRHNARRVLIGCACICLLSVGWYGKNLIVFDNFSSSSWLGMSLWKVARYDYSDGELQDLLDAEVLTDRTVIWFRPFMSPSAYPTFDRTEDDIRILSGDNLHNAIYPEINALYQQNAFNLIFHDIERYLQGVHRAYGHYTCPSSTYELNSTNIEAFPASHHAVSTEIFHMRGLTQEIVRRLGLSPEEYGACSNLYVILPLMVLGYPLWLLFQFRLDWGQWRKGIRRESVLIFIWGIVTFTTVSTSFLEIPENARFKFMVEVPMFLFIAVVLWRLVAPRLLDDDDDDTPGTVETKQEA